MLVRQPKKNKLTTKFDTNLYVVVERKGTQIIAVNIVTAVKPLRSRFLLFCSFLFEFGCCL